MTPDRRPDGPVSRLLDDPRYLAGELAVRYVEPGRGLCTAYVDAHGRHRIRLEPVGVQERAVPLAAQLEPGWLVEHDGEGRDVLGAGDAAARVDAVVSPPAHGRILALSADALATLRASLMAVRSGSTLDAEGRRRAGVLLDHILAGDQVD